MGTAAEPRFACRECGADGVCAGCDLASRLRAKNSRSPRDSTAWVAPPDALDAARTASETGRPCGQLPPRFYLRVRRPSRLRRFSAQGEVFAPETCAGGSE